MAGKDGAGMTKPYLIRSPEFDLTSGGIRVMWGLYGWLLAKGQMAFMNGMIGIPSVGIYPEIFHGNELFAIKVVRYILQTPGMMGTQDQFGEFKAGPTSFPPDDEIYVFSRVYDEWNSDDDHILFLPIIDLHTFKDLGLKRTKKAFYVGKGANLGQHPKEAVELSRQTDTKDQQQLAKFLNECQVLYVYDHLSAIMECARLCGCKVVYLGDLTEKQLNLYEPGVEGLGYKKEVKFNPDLFRVSYKELGFAFSQKLDTFIEKTQ